MNTKIWKLKILQNLFIWVKLILPSKGNKYNRFAPSLVLTAYCLGLKGLTQDIISLDYVPLICAYYCAQNSKQIVGVGKA